MIVDVQVSLDILPDFEYNLFDASRLDAPSLITGIALGMGARVGWVYNHLP
jgi:hypothetical protein